MTALSRAALAACALAFACSGAAHASGRDRGGAGAAMAAICTGSHPSRLVLASYYGAPGERLNRHTASGAVFRPLGLTAAHRTIALGSRLLVEFEGRRVVVVVNDRGPAAATGRELDLSLGAARALGMIHAGVAHVHIALLK